MAQYRIATYLRVSKAERMRSIQPRVCGQRLQVHRLNGESNSISAQRVLLQKYAAKNFTGYELHEFCDDGYTGTNFERPGMQDMLESVRNGEIHCIMVKDFSRFARDYIELGSYIEQIFPFLGVRFISVNDDYDSDNFKGSIADIDVNFKNLLYDLYSKDLSGKVRSSLAATKEKGQYVSANAPFGYVKAQDDRHALLIADDEAEIVRRIFSLSVEGHTSVEIARIFNETQVKTPIEFKMEKRKTSRMPKGEKFTWYASTICQILRNEIYIGNIVQKKYSKDFVGGRNRLNPRDEWLITYKHHEPIIDKEVFDKVQEGRGKKRAPQYNPAHPLVGKLVCGCCKKNLRYRTGLNPYFSCGQRYSNAMEACVRKVNGQFVEEYVLLMLQDQLQAVGELEKLHMEALIGLKREIMELKEERQMWEAKLEKLKLLDFESYQNYVCGKTGVFQSDESVMKSVKRELTSLDANLQEKEAAYFGVEHNRERAGNQFVVLSKEMIENYIDKIEVYDEQHMEIMWKAFL